MPTDPVRVAAYTRYGPMGASSRVRLLQYLPYLAEAGLDVAVDPLLDDDFLRARYAGTGLPVLGVMKAYAARAKRARQGGESLRWVEKELLPWMPLAVERLLASSAPSVIDIDDAIFHQYDHHARFGVRAMLGDKIDRLFARATLVTAGNAYLAERARHAGARWVHVVPSVVPVAAYAAVPRTSNDGVVRIGWIGSPATERYLEPLVPAFDRLAEQGGVRLVLVGARTAPRTRLPVELVRWSEGCEPAALAGMDIGVMPLPDSPFERGKCGYKLVQYMASGLPVVASPVGVNARMVQPGENGWHAETADKWFERLSALVGSADQRARMGAAGSARARAEYSLEEWGPKLAQLLRAAADKGH
jgi:glycosyltransferase involved in cell wall biosynthesis